MISLFSTPMEVGHHPIEVDGCFAIKGVISYLGIAGCFLVVFGAIRFCIDFLLVWLAFG